MACYGNVRHDDFVKQHILQNWLRCFLALINSHKLLRIIITFSIVCEFGSTWLNNEPLSLVHLVCNQETSPLLGEWPGRGVGVQSGPLSLRNASPWRPWRGLAAGGFIAGWFSTQMYPPYVEIRCAYISSHCVAWQLWVKMHCVMFHYIRCIEYTCPGWQWTYFLGFHFLLRNSKARRYVHEVHDCS